MADECCVSKYMNDIMHSRIIYCELSLSEPLKTWIMTGLCVKDVLHLKLSIYLYLIKLQHLRLDKSYYDFGFILINRAALHQTT